MGNARMGRHSVAQRPGEDLKHDQGPPRVPRPVQRAAREPNCVGPIIAFPYNQEPGHSPASADVTASFDVDRSTQHINSLRLSPNHSSDKVNCKPNHNRLLNNFSVYLLILSYSTTTASTTTTVTTSTAPPASSPTSSRTGRSTTEATTTGTDFD